MKTSTKILIGFLTIIILGMVQMSVAYKLQGDILYNTRQIKDVEAPLGILTEQVIGYDAILTGNVHAALLNAQKGNYQSVKDHKEKYEEIGTMLDDLLKKDARILLDQSTRPQSVKDTIDGYLKDLDRINLILVDREERAFAAMAKGDTDTAYSLVIGGDYDINKQALYQDYRNWADIEHVTASSIEDGIIQQSKQIIYFNLIIATVLIILSLVVLLIIYSLFAGRERIIIKREKELDVREKMEQKYRNLFENSTEAIFIADSKTRQLVDCNKAAEKLMGYSRAKLLSMRADELHPKDKLKKTMEGFRKQAEGKIKSIFTEVLTKNKKRIPVKINASAVKIGSKTYSQGIFMEIK